MDKIEINGLLRIRAEDETKFLECVDKLTAMVADREPETLAYTYTRSSGERTVFHVHEAYTSADAMAVHMANVQAETPDLVDVMTVERIDLIGVIPDEIASAMESFCGDGFTNFREI